MEVEVEAKTEERREERGGERGGREREGIRSNAAQYTTPVFEYIVPPLFRSAQTTIMTDRASMALSKST